MAIRANIETAAWKGEQQYLTIGSVTTERTPTRGYRVTYGVMAGVTAEQEAFGRLVLREWMDQDAILADRRAWMAANPQSSVTVWMAQPEVQAQWNNFLADTEVVRARRVYRDTGLMAAFETETLDGLESQIYAHLKLHAALSNVSDDQATI